MRCIQCGKELAPTARFCNNCGTPVAKQEENVSSEVTAVNEEIEGNGTIDTNSVKNVNVNSKITDMKKNWKDKYTIWVIVGIMIIAAGAGLIAKKMKTQNEYSYLDDYAYEETSDEYYDEEYEEVYDDYEDSEGYDDEFYDDSEEELAEPVADDTAIHDYEIIISDGSWYQAMDECYSRGGYLVRINSAEEFEYIADMLDDSGYSKYHFYLGGRRDYDGRGYFWVDENDIFMGELLNSPNSWANAYWYPGEPSFEDNGSDATGSIAENVMNLFCVKGTWYLNDSSDDMAYYYPKLLGGKIGYIVEYE